MKYRIAHARSNRRNKDKVRRVALNLCIDPELIPRIKKFAFTRYLSTSKLVEMAVMRLIDDEEKRGAS